MNNKTDFPSMADAEPGQLFRHQDGGYYQLLGFAHHTTDLQALVIYRHLWPFEQRTWARPEHEWASRFTHITPDELEAAMQQPRMAAQAAISKAKKARRAATLH